MKATLLRRAAAWVAALVFLLPCVPAHAGHDVVLPFPEELTIRMETESWTAADGRQAEADLPVTCQRGKLGGLPSDGPRHSHGAQPK